MPVCPSRFHVGAAAGSTELLKLSSFKGGESSADTRLLAGGHRTVDSSWVVHVLSDSEDIERCNSLCDSAQQRMCLMGLTSLQH